jgi:hypothetical protein
MFSSAAPPLVKLRIFRAGPCPARKVRIEACRGTVSLPFEVGEHKRIAVKIVDDRRIESLKVMTLD